MKTMKTILVAMTLMLGFGVNAQCTLEGSDTTSVKAFNVCNLENNGEQLCVLNGEFDRVAVEFKGKHAVLDSVNADILCACLNKASVNATFSAKNRRTWEPNSVFIYIKEGQIRISVRGKAANGYGNLMPLTSYTHFNLKGEQLKKGAY